MRRPQRVLRLIPDQHDDVVGVFQSVQQMMDDSTCFAHPAGGNDREGPFALVQSHAFRLGPDVTQSGKAEGVAVRLHPSMKFHIQAVGVFSIDRCDFIGQRAIDEDGHGRKLPRVMKFVQEINEGLCSTEAECGDDDSATLSGRTIEDRFQLSLDVILGGMNAVSVGRFGDQDITAFDSLRIMQQRCSPSSEIAGEDDSLPVPSVENLHLGDGGTEDVSGFLKPQPKVFGQVVPFSVGNRFHQFHDSRHVVIVVQRKNSRQFGGMLAIEVAGVFLLNMGTVVQHDIGDIGRRRGAEDGSAKARLVQARQVPTVVGVGV